MGGAASGRRGARYERELVSHFADAGYGALRLPASGSATTRDLPDVLAGEPAEATLGGIGLAKLYAIEVKSGKATTLYVDGDKVDALRAVATAWGASPFLAARPTTQATGREHYLIRPDDARRTDGGRYGLPRAELAERASVVVGPDGVERV